jgi:Zn-dependent M28 family amino/carboxypeptidase
MELDDASGTTAVAEMAKYFSVSSQIRSVLFVFFGGRKVVRIEAFGEKLKQQNFNLYTIQY